MRRPAPALPLVLLAGLLGALAAVPAEPAAAAGRTLRAGYTTAVTVPDPTTGGLPHDTCEGLPASRDRHPVVLPGPGTLAVVLTSTGDWGLVLRDARGRALARSDTAFATGTERAAVRLRGRARVVLEGCNFAGAPQAAVSWTFTPAG